MGGVVLDHSEDVVSRQISLNPEHPNRKSVISPRIGLDMRVSASIYNTFLFSALSLEVAIGTLINLGFRGLGVFGLRGFAVVVTYAVLGITCLMPQVLPCPEYLLPWILWSRRINLY